MASALPAASAASKLSAVETVVAAIARGDHRLYASAFTPESGPNMFAALADVPSSTNTPNVTPVQFLGELWSGKTYERKIAPLVSSDKLRSYKAGGFRFVQAPEVAPYAGDLAEIPSVQPTTEYVEVEAERLAGGYKVDRKFRDFGDEAFIQSLYRESANDYARKSDAALLADMVAGASTITAAATPAGVNPGLARIVDGALSIFDHGTPSFAIVAPDVFRGLAFTTDDDAIAYLSMAITFEGGDAEDAKGARFRIVPRSDLAAGTVLVGARESVTFHELGEAPIRAEAWDIAHGGVDTALFGYYATIINDARALVNVAPPA